MAKLSALKGPALVAAAALALSGCAYDYMQNSDRIAYSSGDAVKANLEAETTNPSDGTRYDTRGLGKNGLVIPASDYASSSTSAQP